MYAMGRRKHESTDWPRLQKKHCSMNDTRENERDEDRVHAYHEPVASSISRKDESSRGGERE